METIATHPVLTIRYDLRSPSFSRSHSELYAAMLEQCRWADRVGFDTVVFSEHHSSEDWSSLHSWSRSACWI